MRYYSTCGLTPAQTTELIARCWQLHTGRPRRQRYDFRMPFGTAVTMVLVMARHNVTQQLAADLYGLSQPTVSRLWRYLLAMLGQVTCLERTDLASALQRGAVLIDGTPVPTGNRAGTGTTNFNVKHHKQALGIQVATRLGGALGRSRLGRADPRCPAVQSTVGRVRGHCLRQAHPADSTAEEKGHQPQRC